MIFDNQLIFNEYLLSFYNSCCIFRLPFPLFTASTVHVSVLWKRIQGEAPLKRTCSPSYRGNALPVQSLWQEVHTLGKLQQTRHASGRLSSEPQITASFFPNTTYNTPFLLSAKLTGFFFVNSTLTYIKLCLFHY